jgi:hypothetical protein
MPLRLIAILESWVFLYLRDCAKYMSDKANCKAILLKTEFVSSNKAYMNISFNDAYKTVNLHYRCYLPTSKISIHYYVTH